MATSSLASLVAAALILATASQNPQPCDTIIYDSAYGYLYSSDGATPLTEWQNRCRNQILSVTQQRFGPPTAFEVMNVMCKGICRVYYDYYQAMEILSADTSCICTERKAQCPIKRTDLLCRFTGLCYEEDWYQKNVCETTACGRFIDNERGYRAQRRVCGQNLDGASSASVGAAAVAGVAVAAALLIQRAAAGG